ncbi:MAG: acyltransferase family protein [Treponemataceae bacterium]
MNAKTENLTIEHKKIASLTGMRFIMVMIVLISHLGFFINTGRVGYFFTKYFLNNATLAVNFFFLLSGFGMMLSSLKKTSQQQAKAPSFLQSIKFGINHVKKIYPVYILTLIAGFVWNFVNTLLTGCSLKSVLHFLKYEFIKLAVNIPLLQTATGSSFFTHEFNGVAWFLSALFCVYLICPLLIFLYKKISRTFVDILLILFNILAIAVFMKFFGARQFCIKGIPIDVLIWESPYLRVFYVFAGMNAAMIFTRLKEKIVNPGYFYSSFFEIFITFIFIIYFAKRKFIPHGSYKYFIDIILCAVFILIFAFDKGIFSKILGGGYFKN